MTSPAVGEIWRPCAGAEPPTGYDLFKIGSKVAGADEFREWFGWTAPGEHMPRKRPSLPAERRAQTREAAVAAMWRHFGALPLGVRVAVVGATSVWVETLAGTRAVRLLDMRAGWQRVPEARR